MWIWIEKIAATIYILSLQVDSIIQECVRTQATDMVYTFSFHCNSVIQLKPVLTDMFGLTIALKRNRNIETRTSNGFLISSKNVQT